MYTCRDCHQSFQTELALELHRDACENGQLCCHECGDRFTEADATVDGWHYECPNDECDGSGLEEDIYPVTGLRTQVTH